MLCSPSTSLPSGFLAAGTGIAAAASWPVVATGALVGMRRGEESKESVSPAQPPPFPTGPKRTWLGNPLCLESSPGSQQATPWQGRCLEPAPTS